jgi:hypothetical protein
VFCGHDSTFALATMSLEPKDMDKFGELGLNEEQTVLRRAKKTRISKLLLGAVSFL